MNCKNELSQEIVALVYDELSADVKQKLEDHLAVCPDCQKEFESLKKAGVALDLFTVDQKFIPKKSSQENSGKKKLSPRIIDGYVIESKIGMGGMGEVFLARQEGMDRKVAIKFLSPRLLNDDMNIQRFLRESKSLGKLNHPNIVQTYDAGCVGKLHYIIMEYIEGSTVRDIIKEKGHISESRALKIVSKVTSALVAAEKNQIVHRDIKPANIMITNDNQIKLMDFGLAKSIEADTSVTATGTTCGSPDYISPEMASMESNISVKSDVYSLGVTLFEMLAGRRPFVATSTIELLSHHMQTKPPKVNELNSKISSSTADLIDRMLLKNPDMRPAPEDVLKQIKMSLSNLTSNKKAQTSKSGPGIYKIFSGLAAACIMIVAGYYLFVDNGNNNRIALKPKNNIAETTNKNNMGDTATNDENNKNGFVSSSPNNSEQMADMKLSEIIKKIDREDWAYTPNSNRQILEGYSDVLTNYEKTIKDLNIIKSKFPKIKRIAMVIETSDKLSKDYNELKEYEKISSKLVINIKRRGIPQSSSPNYEKELSDRFDVFSETKNLLKNNFVYAWTPWHQDLQKQKDVLEKRIINAYARQRSESMKLASQNKLDEALKKLEIFKKCPIDLLVAGFVKDRNMIVELASAENTGGGGNTGGGNTGDGNTGDGNTGGGNTLDRPGGTFMKTPGSSPMTPNKFDNKKFASKDYIAMKMELFKSIVESGNLQSALERSRISMVSAEEDIKNQLEQDILCIQTSQKFIQEVTSNLKAGDKIDITEVGESESKKVRFEKIDINNFVYSTSLGVKEVPVTKISSESYFAMLKKGTATPEHLLGKASLNIIQGQLQLASQALNQIPSSAVKIVKPKLQIMSLCKRETAEKEAMELWKTIQDHKQNNDLAGLSQIVEELQKKYADTSVVKFYQAQIQNINNEVLAKTGDNNPSMTIKIPRKSNVWKTDFNKGKDVTNVVYKMSSELDIHFRSFENDIAKKDMWYAAYYYTNKGELVQAYDVLKDFEEQENKKEDKHWAIKNNALYKKQAEIFAYMEHLVPAKFNSAKYNSIMIKAFKDPSSAPFLSKVNLLKEKLRESKKLTSELRQGMSGEKTVEKLSQLAELYDVFLNNSLNAASCYEVIKNRYPYSDLAKNGDCDYNLAKQYIRLYQPELAANAWEDFKHNASPMDDRRKSRLLFDLSESFNHLGKLFGSANYLAKAELFYFEFLKTAPNNLMVKNGAAYENLANLLVRTNSKEKAVEVFMEMIKKAPDALTVKSGNVHYKLGLLYLDIKNKDKAKERLEILKNDFPNYPEDRLKQLEEYIEKSSTN